MHLAITDTIDERTTPESVQQAAETLHAARPDATLILFGSRARGDARPDSDVDFMVVQPEVKHAGK